MKGHRRSLIVAGTLATLLSAVFTQASSAPFAPRPYFPKVDLPQIPSGNDFRMGQIVSVPPPPPPPVEVRRSLPIAPCQQKWRSVWDAERHEFVYEAYQDCGR